MSIEFFGFIENGKTSALVTNVARSILMDNERNYN